jgi:predicted metal-binding membrane protein
MAMPDAMFTVDGAISFVVQWGVMMTAMMLPSAAPMILLYQTVSRRLSAQGDEVIPSWLFGLVYLSFWMLTGVPVYGAYLLSGALADTSASFNAMMPYIVATLLITTGAYQFSGAKRACLEKCEAPLAFLMNRWRSGYANSLSLAAQHAAYCIGCCWLLMVILVAVGAMSLPWVVTIAAIVFAEKALPRTWRVARLTGVGLIVLGVAVIARPSLATTIRGQQLDAQHHMNMEMR